MEAVKTEEGAPSDEVAALRGSELRMQRQLTEQRRRESKVVLRAAVCESEKRKLIETVSGLQRAVQPAQKQARPVRRIPSAGVRARGLSCGSLVGGTQGAIWVHASTSFVSMEVAITSPDAISPLFTPAATGAPPAPDSLRC